MTTSIQVSVNGNYKVPVKQGDGVNWVETVVSGRDHEGPKTVTFWPQHGSGELFLIGPETPDNASSD